MLRRIFYLCVLTAVLGGCGQKGPLHLPQDAQQQTNGQNTETSQSGSDAEVASENQKTETPTQDL